MFTHNCKLWPIKLNVPQYSALVNILPMGRGTGKEEWICHELIALWWGLWLQHIPSAIQWLWWWVTYNPGWEFFTLYQTNMILNTEWWSYGSILISMWYFQKCQNIPSPHNPMSHIWQVQYNDRCSTGRSYRE